MSAHKVLLFPFHGIALLSLLAGLLSCSDKKDVKQNDPEGTPEVLEEERTDLHISSAFYKRSHQDIIQLLFEEAMEKDEQLRLTYDRTIQIEQLEKDSLRFYHSYMQNNRNYWQTLGTYTTQLGDTLLREAIRQHIQKMKDMYDLNVSPLDTLYTQLKVSEQRLSDLTILMKILVTEPMMRNYQQNEYPDSSTLSSVKYAYDSLIKEVGPYTNFDKK